MKNNDLGLSGTLYWKVSVRDMVSLTLGDLVYTRNEIQDVAEEVLIGGGLRTVITERDPVQVTTNESGEAYFRLRTGSCAGKIRILAKVVKNANPALKTLPGTQIEFAVHPKLNREKLSACCGCESDEQLRKSHQQWVEEALHDGGKIRQSEWTKSIPGISLVRPDRRRSDRRR